MENTRIKSAEEIAEKINSIDGLKASVWTNKQSYLTAELEGDSSGGETIRVYAKHATSSSKKSWKDGGFIEITEQNEINFDNLKGCVYSEIK